MKKLTALNLDRDLHTRLKIIARAKGVPMYQIVEDYIKLGMAIDVEMERMREMGFTEADCKMTIDKVIKGIAAKKMLEKLRQHAREL